MRVSRGLDRGVLSGSVHTLNFSYPSAVENNYWAAPVALQTTEPGTPQQSWTVTSTMLPSCSQGGVAITVCAQIYVSGYNSNASTVTLYYRVKRSGVSLTTASTTTAATTYYTLHIRGITPSINVQVGDTLDLFLWASTTGVDHRYNAIVFFPGRIRIQNPAGSDVFDETYHHITYSNFSKYPTLSRGTEYTGVTYYFYPAFAYSNIYEGINANKTYDIQLPFSDTLGGGVVVSSLNRLDTSDITSTLVNRSTTTEANAPVAAKQWVPATISFRRGFRV